MQKRIAGSRVISEHIGSRAQIQGWLGARKPVLTGLMAHVCILYAVENQAFASKIERVLHEMGHAVSRREVDEDTCAILGAAAGEPDAMVVIWSNKSIASPTVIAEAREAVARRTLTRWRLERSNLQQVFSIFGQ